MKLTEIDREFVEMLCGPVRCASEGQHDEFAALRGIKNPKAARRRRYFLVASGLLKFADVPARPSIRLTGPLFTWVRGEPGPDAHALSYAAEKRFTAPLEPTRIYYATPKAIRLFGGHASGEMPNAQQCAHDLCVTSIYLNLLSNDPEVAALYRGEDRDGGLPGNVSTASPMRSSATTMGRRASRSSSSGCTRPPASPPSTMT